MMDPASLVVGALAAGASEGLTDAASAAVGDLYRRVKAMFAGSPKAELVLAEHEAEPDVWAGPLRQQLSEVGAEGDADLIALAERVMALVDPDGVRAGKYVVSMTHSTGVQLGDHNRQVNHFGD